MFVLLFSFQVLVFVLVWWLGAGWGDSPRPEGRLYLPS